MPTDLITDAEFDEIQGAIQDVTQTFHKKPVTLKHRVKFSVDPQATPDATDIALVGLFVPRKTDDDSEVHKSSSGFLDDSEGYVNFDFQYLLTHSTPLITLTGTAPSRDTKVLIVPNKDTLLIDGEELDIIAVNLVAPNRDIHHLVKVSWRRRIAKEKT